MSKIALTDGSGRWFRSSKAVSWEESTHWNGNNHISDVTGSQWEHEMLFRTAGGLYILHHWSQWQGSGETYEEISAEEAAVWLTRNKEFSPEDEKLKAAVANLEMV